MTFRAADPCSLYTGPEYERCRRFHAETRREMTKYRVGEAVGLGMVALGLVTGVGLVGLLAYGIYDARKASH
jgi:hypothetical protein